MVFLLVLLTIVVVICVQQLARVIEQHRLVGPATAFRGIAAAGQTFVHEGHTWARLDTSGEAKIGIDHFLMKVLGGADRVACPAPGRIVTQGERIFSVWRNGREVELVSPIEGVVVSLNESADLNTETAKKDPYAAGWLFSIRPRNLAESLSHVRSLEQAAGWFDSEVKRFSTFLVEGSVRYAGVGATMQDGGQYPAGIIEKMGEEQFKAFKSRFLSRI